MTEMDLVWTLKIWIWWIPTHGQDIPDFEPVQLKQQSMAAVFAKLRVQPQQQALTAPAQTTAEVPNQQQQSFSAQMQQQPMHLSPQQQHKE